MDGANMARITAGGEVAQWQSARVPECRSGRVARVVERCKFSGSGRCPLSDFFPSTSLISHLSLHCITHLYYACTAITCLFFPTEKG